MSYRPPPQKIAKQIFFEQESEIIVGTGDDFNNSILPAIWEIVRDGRSPAGITQITLNVLAAVMRRDSGASSIRVDTASNSTKGPASSTYTTLSSTDAAFTAKAGGSSSFFNISDSDNFLFLSIYNNDGATSGRVKDLKLAIQVYVPFGTTLKRVV